MVVMYTDEQPDRDLTINEESRSQSKSGYSLRRTSARVKKTREASNSPPPERKRTAAASSKKGRIEKKTKTENAESTTATAVVAGGGHSDDSAIVAVEKSAYAKVTETLRKFNKYYLHFIQVVKSVFMSLWF